MANCTVADNEHIYGGNDFQLGQAEGPLANIVATDSIFWDDLRIQPEYVMQAEYCNVLGGWSGTGNFADNPVFVSGPQGDYYLSQIDSGQLVDSPCLDAGHDLATAICLSFAGETICLSELATRTDEQVDGGLADVGYHYSSPEGLGSIGCALDCAPSSGTVPFTTSMSVSLLNNLSDQSRRVAGRIDLLLGGGGYFPNWRAGFTNISPGDSYSTMWGQSIPNLPTLIGENIFTLIAEDVTPAPYNQPPYTSAGDSASAFCTVTGIAP